jgi:hypothetical protein
VFSGRVQPLSPRLTNPNSGPFCESGHGQPMDESFAALGPVVHQVQERTLEVTAACREWTSPVRTRGDA